MVNRIFSYSDGAFYDMMVNGLFTLVQGHVIPALSSTPAFAGPYSPLHTTTGLSSCAQREKCFFPERPGQPECEYYKKTGNCKFGSSCKFHHPPDWVPPNSNCSFSPLGLPLRPVC